MPPCSFTTKVPLEPIPTSLQPHPHAVSLRTCYVLAASACARPDSSGAVEVGVCAAAVQWGASCEALGVSQGEAAVWHNGLSNDYRAI